MTHRQVVCAVVDGFSTGTALAPVFAAYGFETVHVRSPGYIPEVLTASFSPSNYVEVHELADPSAAEVSRVCSELTAHGRVVACVVPGAETGVRMADALSEQLGCATNGTALSGARRDKTRMADEVARAGLATIPHLRSHSAKEAVVWADHHGINPVVIKPPASSGTYGFHICDGPEDLTQTLAKVLGSRDIFDNVVDEVVVQPFVTGTEFSVNSVSGRGTHMVTDAWLTRKRHLGPSMVYDVELLLPPSDPRWQVLVEYVSGVLDALGIRHGPAHTEVMLTEAGPVLIESGARFMGSVDIALVTAATGTNAVLQTASAYLTPERFAADAGRARCDPSQHPATVQMHATKHGRLAGYRMVELGALDTYFGVDTYLVPGDAVVPTVNSYTSPGLVFLLADSVSARDADVLRVRELEVEGRLYDLE